MFNGSYNLIEILEIGIETVHLIKSNWLYFEKKINWLWKITKKKFSHAGTWTRAFWVEGSYADHYTTRNILYWSDKSKINFMYMRADSALTWSLT